MRRIAIAIFPLLAWSAGVAAAQDPSVRLTVRIKGDQTTFHIGEVIPLELVFTSSESKKYQLDTATYDRSGRLNEESFAVKPEAGWDDPMYLYFHAFQGFMGGGLRGFQVLSGEPALVNLELNEWVRFQTPGEYRVTVTSARVSKVDAQVWGGPGVTSNELTLTIVPATPEWQQETLQQALKVLGAKPAATQSGGRQDPRRDAVKVLRYLGTPTAARELARRLDDQECASDCRFGLIGSPARAAGLDEMRGLLTDPDFPVSSLFLNTISVVGLPADAAGDLSAQRERLEASFREQLAAVLETKRGKALAASANTIVEDAAIYSRELPAALKRTVTAQLIANFDQLPIAKQAELIEIRWKALDQKAMLPVIEKVAERYRDAPALNETNIWEFNSASRAALQHWYELDPARARPAFVREILRPHPRFGAGLLGMLPERELPEVEQPLVDHLRDSQNSDAGGNVASLIHRYASPAMESQVIAYLDERLGKLACATQEPMLAYLLKVDPAAASPRLAKALAARGQGFSACNHALLTEVGKLQNDPALEELAIHALDDPDAQVAGSAAAYLGDFGSAAAETALWTHLTAWSERWSGREKELRYIPEHGMDGVWQAGFGTNMMQALATGKGWLADESKLSRLMQLSVGEQQRQTAERWLQTWQARPLVVQFIPSGTGQFQIAQYQANSLQAAKDKLVQFPSGTVFHFRGSGIPYDGEEKTIQELSDFAAQHGMKVTRTVQ